MPLASNEDASSVITVSLDEKPGVRRLKTRRRICRRCRGRTVRGAGITNTSAMGCCPSWPRSARWPWPPPPRWSRLLLGFKPVLHRWVGALEGKELRAGLKRLLISVVLLPILPDGGYGQYGGLLSVWCLTTSV